MQRTLYGYWRSSASYRVRLALHLKGLDFQNQAVNLVKNAQNDAGFTALNPQGLVPLYREGEGEDAFLLSQSVAIIDYLEERYSDKPLLPRDSQKRASIKAMSLVIACEIHPLDNLRVLNYLQNTLAVAEVDKLAWYRHWIDQGFSTIEKQLPEVLAGAPFSLGERPGYLEAFIVPQVYNARRFDCDLSEFPGIVALTDACNQLPEFVQALPENQPDAT